MRERRNFPPFIHSKASGAAEDEGRLLVALANATGIARMFQGHYPENKHFLCQTIRLDQERIRNEVTTQTSADVLREPSADLCLLMPRPGPIDPTGHEPGIVGLRPDAYCGYPLGEGQRRRGTAGHIHWNT